MIKEQSNTNKKGTVIDPQKKPIILGAVIAVAILLIAVLMFVENAKGTMVISNNTGAKLEYVKAYFVDVEGPLHDGFTVENLEAGKSQRFAVGEHKLLGLEANLEIRFKFEGAEEVFVDAGYFNDTFRGDLTIDFRSTDEQDVAILHVKANNGLLKSNLIDCDDEFTINIAEGYEIE